MYQASTKLTFVECKTFVYVYTVKYLEEEKKERERKLGLTFEILLDKFKP